jgi:hypothetical protein
MTTPGATPTDAAAARMQGLQAGLAAEHALVWGYGVVGGRIGEQLIAQVREADTAHRTRRDAVVALIVKGGGVPTPTEPGYALPFPVTDRRTALRLAVHLEDGAAAAWRYAVASTDDRAVRRTALAALADSAVRATRWRRLLLPASPATVPFPGTTP